MLPVGISSFEKGIVSEFNQRTFKRVDPLARWLIIQAYANQGVSVFHNPNKFDVDLYSPVAGFLEVGIKLSSWLFGEKPFPFDSLSVEKRKRSYMVDPTTLQIRSNVTYIYISADLTHAAFTMGKNLVDGCIEWKRTKRANGKEPFFHVPLVDKLTQEKKCVIYPLGVDLRQIPNDIASGIAYKVDKNGNYIGAAALNEEEDDL